MSRWRGSFASSEAWTSLVDEALSRLIGVEGAKFCHKNRFIAIFATREATLAAIDKWGLSRAGVDG